MTKLIPLNIERIKHTASQIEYTPNGTLRHRIRKAKNILIKLQEASYRCEKCNAKEMLTIHHITYTKSKYRNSSCYNPKNQKMKVLCLKCHKKEHKK